MAFLPSAPHPPRPNGPLPPALSEIQLRYWWYEIFELLRKLFLSAIAVFVYSGQPTQLLISQFVAFGATFLVMALRPYCEESDDWLAAYAQAEVFLLLNLGQMIRVGAATSDKYDLVLLGAVMVVSSAALIFFTLYAVAGPALAACISRRREAAVAAAAPGGEGRRETNAAETDIDSPAPAPARASRQQGCSDKQTPARTAGIALPPASRNASFAAGSPQGPQLSSPPGPSLSRSGDQDPGVPGEAVVDHAPAAIEVRGQPGSAAQLASDPDMPSSAATPGRLPVRELIEIDLLRGTLPDPGPALAPAALAYINR